MLLITGRVVLRELELADLEFVASMLADPVVMRYYPKCLTRAEAQGWIERQQERYRRDGHGLWLVSLQATGQPIGQIGLLLQALPAGPDWEVGYLLDRRFWHQGYATEAGLVVRDYAFRMLRPSRVISLIRPENTPSQRVALRLGMQAVEDVQLAGVAHSVFAVTRAAAEEFGTTRLIARS